MSLMLMLTPDVLYQLYVNEKLSTDEIAHKLGITYSQVKYKLAQHDIPMRNHRDAAAISAPRYLKVRQAVTCPICGKEFEPAPYRLKRSKLICCSRECGRHSRLKQLEEAQEKRLLNHPRVDKVCEICGSHFSTNYSARNRRRYCSQQCKGVALIKQLARRTKPTRPEQAIIDIVTKHFPQFKYNGNGEAGIVLSGLVPDFVNVNGKKEIIEVFGDYYHTVLATNWRKTELGRKMAYNSVGYDCLVLWEHEIKAKSEAEIVATISKYTNKRR